MADSPVDHPPHYNLGASVCARPALAALGIAHYDSECIETIEQGYPWLLENSYAFTAVVYLWRCEHKGSLQRDLEKALWFLNRGANYWQSFLITTEKAEQLGGVRACKTEVERLLTRAIAPS
jgi:hypothetical protein